MTRLPYRSDIYQPAAPVVPMVVAAPNDLDRVELPALVDTGADATIIPLALVRALRLPRVDTASLQGIGPAIHRAGIHAAIVRVGRFRGLLRVTAIGDEALIGRDLLERLVLVLDGPTRTLTLRMPRRTAAP